MRYAKIAGSMSDAAIAMSDYVLCLHLLRLDYPTEFLFLVFNLPLVCTR